MGVTGVDWRARIMPIRVTDANGLGYDSLIAQGLIWAAEHGARVANVSFLGVSRSLTVQSATQYMRNKGGIVVIPAGNTGQQRFDPPSDLGMVAAAAGAYTERVSDPDDLEAALRRGLEETRHGRAAVVDVQIVPI